MPETQQKWAFRVGDGASTEVFVQLEGMRECPDFTPFNRTLRDATTIADAQTSNTKKKKFNRQMEGPELSIKLDYLPGSTATGQARLTAMEGDDDGVNCQLEIQGDEQTITWEFNALVHNRTIMPAAAGDSEAVESVQYSLVINSDVNETVV